MRISAGRAIPQVFAFPYLLADPFKVRTNPPEESHCPVNR
jgi:hypothetical protein